MNLMLNISLTVQAVFFHVFKHCLIYWPLLLRTADGATTFSTLLYGHIKTAELRTIIQQYGDWYTGR